MMKGVTTYFFLNLRQQDLFRDEQFKTLANKHLETR